MAMVLLLGLGFWRLWPRGPYRMVPEQRLPEPGAAYVRVSPTGSPLVPRPARFAQGDGASGEAGLPLTPQLPPPETLPPPAYRPPTVPEYAANFDARLPDLPPMLPEAATPFDTQPAGPPRGMELSATLREVGFVFEPPPDALMAHGRFKFRLYLSPDGRVAHLLEEEGAEGPARLAWRQALLRGRGRTNATGTVTVEWLP